MNGHTPDWQPENAALRQTASTGTNQKRHQTARSPRRMLALFGILLLGFGCCVTGIASAADAVGATAAPDAADSSGNVSSAAETYGAESNPTGNPIG
ncbi:MAG: hypothetical protein QMD46_12830, partial [Methanomicrobiales archaeon]|nr:hypothetical protein [Methanomicrobiales archaeon]